MCWSLSDVRRACVFGHQRMYIEDLRNDSDHEINDWQLTEDMLAQALQDCCLSVVLWLTDNGDFVEKKHTVSPCRNK